MKKVFSFFLAIAIVFSMPIGALASEMESIGMKATASAETNGDDEFFRFNNATSRIASDGTFEFYCNSYLDSDIFTANSNTITVKATAKLYNRNTGKTISSSKEFTITVHEVGGSDLTPVFVGKLNGSSASAVSVNVTKGSEYYLTIRSSSDLDAVLYMSGSGSVSPIIVY